MNNSLLSIAEAIDIIQCGKPAMIAGAERALRQLPKGCWIGGTTVYHMTNAGGIVDHEKVFVTVFDDAASARVRTYSADKLEGLVAERSSNGFTAVIIPAFSSAHFEYALRAPAIPGIYNAPVAGWISGVHLPDIATQKPKVLNGMTGEICEDGVMAMQVALSPGTAANLEIVNLFEQGDGDALTFPKTAFSASECLVNGTTANFARYLSDKRIDTRLPLVANYAGAMVNVSIQAVDAASGKVDFYAPVTEGMTYRIARPVADYVRAFEAQLSSSIEASFSCNCILNFLYAQLEGKRTGRFVGPVTFGEVAYILVNQTLVCLSVVRT